MKNVVEGLLNEATDILVSKGIIPKDAPLEIRVDNAKNKEHGDYATNIALILAKPCKMAPRDIAKAIIDSLPEHQNISKVEIAGPGFINFYLGADAKTSVINTILDQQEDFGRVVASHKKKVLVEFVSANPTGPLHVGHGRGAAFGASLANLLDMAGFAVTREYYVNDAGRQMNILALSVWLRYLAFTGIDITFPTNAYKGEYVKEYAKELAETYDNKYTVDVSALLANLPPDEPEGGDKEKYVDALISRMQELLGIEVFNLFHKAALDRVLADIQNDLHGFRVDFDSWFSEKSLLQSGDIDKGIKALQEGGHTYEKDGALWFKASAFGDEKDRVLIRANGVTTYFASDVAYHWNKYNRGFDRVLDIFGADHHGYVSRVRAAVRALGHDDNDLNVCLVQFAILYRGDKRLQMSTRSGEFVTLRQLREEVGNDAARFFYVMRKPEQHMDFDLELAKSQSNDNPVYYIQYAHARICSVIRQLTQKGYSYKEDIGLSNLDLLKEQEEENLLGILARFPDTIKNAARTLEPHQIAYYLRELATSLHSYYNAIILLCEDESLRAARLTLLKAIQVVLRNGMKILGVNAPESM